jgi:hypothetical protein
MLTTFQYKSSNIFRTQKATSFTVIAPAMHLASAIEIATMDPHFDPHSPAHLLINIPTLDLLLARA